MNSFDSVFFHCVSDCYCVTCRPWGRRDAARRQPERARAGWARRSRRRRRQRRELHPRRRPRTRWPPAWRSGPAPESSCP